MEVLIVGLMCALGVNGSVNSWSDVCVECQ